MLIFIGSRRQTWVLRHLKRDDRMPAWTCHTYQWLFRTGRLPAATYIFTGVNRLDAGERRLAAQFYRHIKAQGVGFRALNDPAIGMGRYRLLRSLHEAGINDFNAYLAAERDRPSRYPVFIRRDSSSTPPLTGLLHSSTELSMAVERLIAAGEPAEDLVIIEHCAEAAGPGVYRMLPHYRFAQRNIPCTSLFASDWFVKYETYLDVPAPYHESDVEILDSNPYGEVVMRAFDIAGIEYGRADMGIVGGRPQFYEINYNPDLTTRRQQPYPNLMHNANRIRVEDTVFEAMRQLDVGGHGSAASLSNDELNQFRLRFWRNYAPQRY